MSDDEATIVPVWTLITVEGDAPPFASEPTMTGERLAELRSVLAAMAKSPITTLEVHSLPENLDRNTGIQLSSLSPLARHLSALVGQTSKSAQGTNIAAGGEALYRMVVPAKVAAQVGSGLRAMPSKAVAGGIHGAIVGKSGITAQATFVPVAAGAGALTVAAPLIFMAVAAGMSAHADHQRQQALEKITKLLEKLHQDKLDDERDRLDGTRNAIDKATAALLDNSQIRASLGLDTAVGKIDDAVAAATRRLKQWQKSLKALPVKVELAKLRETFPGIDTPGGEFRTHLELAALAIALRRRVLVLQAVEHSQLDEANPLENFMSALKADSERVDELEAGIAEVLDTLSHRQLTSSRKIVDVMVSSGEVNRLLTASYRLRSLGGGDETSRQASDVAIDIARHKDGSLLVLPALAV
ncbi:hypothetical protein ACPCIR_05380 [Mycobacterium sp. NPDC051198]